MRPGSKAHLHIYQRATCILFRGLSNQHNCYSKLHILINLLFIIVMTMSSIYTVEGRPYSYLDFASHDAHPSSSSGASHNLSDSSAEYYNSTKEIGELRYNVRQLYSASLSQVSNHNRSGNAPSSEQVIFLPHSLQEREHDQQNRTFLEESRRAFQRLGVQPPLLPDEERRRIWLERHHHRKLALRERREQSISHNRFVGLSSANFTNSTNHTCKGDLFKHKVRMAGCEPKIIINRFCHGSCSSVYIPKLHTRDLRAQFRSCAACVPSETDLVQIKLDCPGRVEREIVRTVMRVKRCACRNIEMDDYEDVGEGIGGIDD